MKISRLLLLWFFVVGTINAQQKATEVIRLFGTNTSVQWNVPIEGKSILLNWQARPNSLAQEGFRTFVAYHNGNFAGTLSMNKTTLSGEVWHDGHSYFINTENGMLKVTTDKEHFTCGTCADGQCSQATTPTPKDYLCNLRLLIQRLHVGQYCTKRHFRLTTKECFTIPMYSEPIVWLCSSITVSTRNVVMVI